MTLYYDAIETCDQAITIDPKFAPAYATKGQQTIFIFISIITEYDK